MMLKLTIKDILKQRTFGMIGIISGITLGVLYYFLTLEMALTHLSAEIELLPLYMAASIGLTGIVAVLAGINIALVAYNIKTQRNKNMRKSGTSAVLGGALTAFTPGCPACTAPLAVILGAVGGLSLFPMQGLELKFISVGVLVFSIYWITRGLQSKSCCKIG